MVESSGVMIDDSRSTPDEFGKLLRGLLCCFTLHDQKRAERHTNGMETERER